MTRFVLQLTQPSSASVQGRDSGDASMVVGAVEVGDDRKARALESLSPLVAADPGLFSGGSAQPPAWLDAKFRVYGDVRGVRIAHGRLVWVLDCLRARLRALAEASPTRDVRSNDDVDALIEELAAGSRSIALSKQVYLLANDVAVLVEDSWARRLVAARQVVPELRVDAGSSTRVLTRAVWTLAPGITAPAHMSHAAMLVDAHARVTCDAIRRHTPAAAAHFLAGLDSRGGALLDALGEQATACETSAAQRRQLAHALDVFVASGTRGALLRDMQARLVVRIAEAPSDTHTHNNAEQATDVLRSQALWLIEVCVRERHGTVHPVDALVAAGDIQHSDALEYAVRVRSHAATLASAQPQAGALSWLMSTEDVSRFLHTDVEDLERGGIDVLMPCEWAKQRVRVSAHVTATASASHEDDSGAAAPSHRTEGSAVVQAMGRFDFYVAIGDLELSEEEAQALLRTQQELVHVRGRWVRVDASTLRAAHAFLEAFAVASSISEDPHTRTAIAHARMHRAAGAAITPTQFAQIMRTPGLDALELDVRATAPRAASGTSGGLEALFGANVDLPEISAPTGLRAHLRPYQMRGLQWLSFLDTHGLGGILADDMGLGKTMQVLALLVRERENPGGVPWDRVGGPTLLVCPVSVLGSWQREAETFAPQLRVLIHHGPERLRGKELSQAVHEHDLVLTTYALLVRDGADLQGISFYRVIMDEAQHVKNADTQVSASARALAPGRRLALTGTPVENGLSDMHSIMQVTNPGLLPPSVQEFERVFSDPITRGEPGARERLQRVIQPYVLRRLKTDRSIIADLPRKQEQRVFVTITAEQAGLYQAIVDEMSRELARGGSPRPGASDPSHQARGGSGMQRRAIISGAVMRLKQVLNHPAHYLGDGSSILDESGQHRSGKLERIDDLLTTLLARGEKALIFTQFTSFAPTLIAHWERTHGVPVPFLHGGVAKVERERMMKKFQSSPHEAGIMLLSLRAGGTGITLTAANHVIHLDRWWNPAVENQATDRAFRIGQQRDVFVHKLVAAGTIEEAIDDTLMSKDALAQASVTSGDAWLANLPDAALASMFALRGSAR